jgi:hypothetical protein
MITSLVALAAPFIGGVIITQFNFKTVFFLSACILLLALLPLLFFKKRKVSPHLTAKHLWAAVINKKHWAHTISNIGYANSFIIHVVLWKLFLFLQIGNIEEFGGLISLSLLISSLVTFMAGSMTDHGKRKKVLIITSIITALIWASRFFVTTALTASLSHLFFYLSFPALIVASSLSLSPLGPIDQVLVGQLVFLGNNVIVRSTNLLSRPPLIGENQILVSISLLRNTQVLWLR